MSPLIPAHPPPAPSLPTQVYPEKGTVCFSAGLHGWAFTLTSFARMYASKFGIDEDKMMNRWAPPRPAAASALCALRAPRLLRPCGSPSPLQCAAQCVPAALSATGKGSSPWRRLFIHALATPQRAPPTLLLLKLSTTSAPRLLSTAGSGATASLTPPPRSGATSRPTPRPASAASSSSATTPSSRCTRGCLQRSEGGQAILVEGSGSGRSSESNNSCSSWELRAHA